MNILMIDTSGPACGVAVMKDGVIVCELQLTSGKTHCNFFCLNNLLK